jgi:uncharacterized RDD family membrane protein YckC
MVEAAIQHRESEQARRRTLVTPEGVDLSLRLADIGQRVGAFLLDLVIMVGMLVGLTIACLIFAFTFGLTSAEIAIIVWLLGFFLLRNFYFVIMEMGPRAATFGKRASGLRVVARSGERLTADRVIARNMMREIEFYLPLSFLFYNASAGTSEALTSIAGLLWTGIFLFFPKFNKDRMRIGDLLAGTWVVNAPRKKLGTDLLNAVVDREAYSFTDAQLDVYGVYELQTLEQVLRDSRAESVATVAAAIRVKIDVPYDNVPDHDFLTAYYNAARARMERGLLFGKRRADKFDRAGG